MMMKKQILVKTIRGKTAVVSIDPSTITSPNQLFCTLWHVAQRRDAEYCTTTTTTQHEQQHWYEITRETDLLDVASCTQHQQRNKLEMLLSPPSVVQWIHEGNYVSMTRLCELLLQEDEQATKCCGPIKHSYLHEVKLTVPILGGIDRQNRVGSKFGGGGVSSSQQAERERKERLKQLALESIDLAKDPYLMRNHLGTYECKLCLTLHTNEANYLAHTQGKKHQQGLARRAHMEKLRQEKEGTGSSAVGVSSAAASTRTQAPARKKVRIGRPAYQVFKSRDPQTNQRCLSFELNFAEIQEDLQPRHRFMSAFEQRIESPPDRRYQYLLFAAEPYETVAFKIPNEPIDKDPGRFVTHWNAEEKKFILTLYFREPEKVN